MTAIIHSLENLYGAPQETYSESNHGDKDRFCAAYITKAGLEAPLSSYLEVALYKFHR